MARTYEAMQKVSTGYNPRARFLDLQNRKQVGDLEKKIRQYNQKNNAAVFNFASARPKEGVSTVLCNLIQYFRNQNSSKKILIIDANFNSPSLHRVFNTGDTVGLSELLSGKVSTSEIFNITDSDNVFILPGGKESRDLSGNIDPERFKSILSEVKSKFDYIFIDSAAILDSSDALTIATASDVTFWVLKSIVVQKEVALKAKSLLIDNECEIGGIILNQIRQVIPEWIYRIF